MQQDQITFIELPILETAPVEEVASCKSVKNKCCKKYKKKGRHCKKCPKLLLTDPSINFSSNKILVEA